MQPAQTRATVVAKSALAAFLAALFLFVSTLAASPALHHWFHSQLPGSTDGCVVCLVAHGKVASSPPVIFVPFVVFGLVLLVVWPAAVNFPKVEYSFARGRAPPGSRG